MRRAWRHFGAALALGLAATVALGTPATPRLPDAERPLGVPASVHNDAAERSERERGGGGLSEVLAMLGPLAAVLAVIAGMAFVVRAAGKRSGLAGLLGAGGRAPSGVVEVLGRYPVGRGQMLALLKVGRRVLVVGQTQGRGGGMRTLSEITDVDEVAALVTKAADAAGTSLAKAFTSALHRQDDAIAATLVEAKPMPARGPDAPSAVRSVTVNASGDRVELLRTLPHAAPSARADEPGLGDSADPIEALRRRLEAARPDLRGRLDERASA